MAESTSGRYDVGELLRGLDAIFEEHRGANDAEPFLRAALVECVELGDRGAELTVLNELMGFYRSVSRHVEATEVADRALALVAALGIEGSDAGATTLINAATALRAAGRYDDAFVAYHRALEGAEATMASHDRRLAALHNNLSILFSETGDQPRAADELRAALQILEASAVDPGGDLDIATTCTNLALVLFTLGRENEANELAHRSMEIVSRGGHESNGHYAAVVAGHAEACFRLGNLDDAVAMYRSALAIIAECYGTDNDYYAVTAANLTQVLDLLGEVRDDVDGEESGTATGESPEPTAEPQDGSAAPRLGGSRGAGEVGLSGLQLARAYWEEHGPGLLARYPEQAGRIAVGLVGHGSDCYGFDDAISRDHDFGPGFCLWLTPEDHAAIGASLQADYEALPPEFLGVGPRLATARARGAGRRVGVFEIGAFYESITGHSSAPATEHEWLLLEEPVLAAATNGAIFADPLGAFSGVRAGFRRMPTDVRLALVSRRLGMASQAGQYNVPRMLERGDGEAAWLAVGEFVRAVASLVFLLNRPTSVGYLPYYKWQFAALRRLGARLGTRLPDLHEELARAMRLASSACFGGAGFGEGGRGAGPAREELEATVERICARIAAELAAMGLIPSDATFLEHQRPFVAQHIDSEWLRSL